MHLDAYAIAKSAVSWSQDTFGIGVAAAGTTLALAALCKSTMYCFWESSSGNTLTGYDFGVDAGGTVVVTTGALVVGFVVGGATVDGAFVVVGALVVVVVAFVVVIGAFVVGASVVTGQFFLHLAQPPYFGMLTPHGQFNNEGHGVAPTFTGQLLMHTMQPV